MKSSGKRRQFRCCDQCRKSKRACDADELALELPKSYLHSQFGDSQTTCSNCKRWRRKCTFNWLRSKREINPAIEQPTTLYDIYSPGVSRESILDGSLNSQALLQKTFEIPFPAFDDQESLESLNFHITDEPLAQVANSPSNSSWTLQNPLRGSELESAVHDIPNNLESEHYTDKSLRPELPDAHKGRDMAHAGCSQNLDPPRIATVRASHRPGKESVLFGHGASFHSRNNADWNHVNDSLSSKYTRSTMTECLLRIYHDSMENALSCWLTERNCPYTNTRDSNDKTFTGTPAIGSVYGEWGPKWSNRIFSRIRRLDAASLSLYLTASEKRRASKALDITIMAFASQWTRNAQRRRLYFEMARSQSSGGTAHSTFLNPETSSIIETEHSIRENLWNQAYNSLRNCDELFSFQVIFANIIFSLTQRPLNINEYIANTDPTRSQSTHSASFFTRQSITCDEFRHLDELQVLFEKDCAPSFLDTALRQLFSIRYRLFAGQRYRPQNPRSLRSGQRVSLTELHNHANLVREGESRETFDLLFWLGVMFDTLTSALNERPPVVSDEDSKVPYQISGTTERPEKYVDLDGWSPISEPRSVNVECDLWGEMFLKRNIPLFRNQSNVSGWPYSYHDAAEILSDAAPVKVLLFRRVCHLQTLLYRGTSPELLEVAVQDTLEVYNYWNQTFGQFMVNCVANHNELPFRIRSWYMILAGHWHLAAMIFADVLEHIDEARLGLESQRESRHFEDQTTNIKKRNALAVSDIARCSLQEQYLSFTDHSQTHVSLNGGALLSEPWTIILIRSFTKACLILIQCGGTRSNFIIDKAQLCIDALWRLGKKSDMSFLAAYLLKCHVDQQVKQPVHNV